MNNTSLEAVTRKVRPALEHSAERVRLDIVAGVHGTQVDSVYRLARDGLFSGGAADEVQEKFFLTPNINYSGWRQTNFVYEIDQSPPVNPIEVARAYAEAGSLERFKRSEPDNLEPIYGVVVTFGRQVLELVERVDINDLDEPEVTLRRAPSLESIQGIYPVDAAAASALLGAIASLQFS